MKIFKNYLLFFCYPHILFVTGLPTPLTFVMCPMGRHFISAKQRANSNALVVKHHNTKYDGNFPIWVIIEYFSMGMLSYCYVDLKSVDQKAIAKDAFSSSASCISSWLRCVTDLRNRCAHYSRLYYWIFPAIPLTPKNSAYQMDRKLFSQIVMLKYLYPDKNEWKSRFIAELEALIEEYASDISLKHIGFPDNWRELLNT